MTNPRRRQSGEGGISEYVAKAGPRFLIKYGYTRADGSRAVALKRGYPTRKAAAAALRGQLGNVDKGTHVAPSRITVGEHMATWLDGAPQGTLNGRQLPQERPPARHAAHRRATPRTAHRDQTHKAVSPARGDGACRRQGWALRTHRPLRAHDHSRRARRSRP